MAQDALEIIERDVEVIEVVGGGDVEVIEVFNQASVEVVEVWGRGEAEVIEVFDSGAEVVEVVERGPQGPVGPIGPQGPAGESGGITSWNELEDKPSEFPPEAHTHGNLTNDGRVGSTAGLPIVTTSAGAIMALAIGTVGQVLKVNTTGTAVEFGNAGFGEVRFDTSGNYTYTGQAVAGSLESSPVWFIRRSEFSSTGSYVATTTANNVEWDDRLTVNYT